MAAKKQQVPISTTEIKFILRSYCAHPADWDTIIEEMKINSSFLPKSAADLYMDGDAKKLRRRMNDRVTKLINTEIDKVDEELQLYVKEIKEISNKCSKKGAPESRKNNKTTLKTISASASSPSSSSSSSTTLTTPSSPAPSTSALPSSSSGKKRRTAGNRESPTKRRRFVDLQDSGSSDDDEDSPPRRLSNSELAREANKLYIDFASKTLPKMYEKMSKCMDKYLKD